MNEQHTASERHRKAKTPGSRATWGVAIAGEFVGLVITPLALVSVRTWTPWEWGVRRDLTLLALRTRLTLQWAHTIYTALLHLHGAAARRRVRDVGASATTPTVPSSAGARLPPLFPVPARRPSSEQSGARCRPARRPSRTPPHCHSVLPSRPAPVPTSPPRGLAPPSNSHTHPLRRPLPPRRRPGCPCPSRRRLQQTVPRHTYIQCTCPAHPVDTCSARV